MPCDIFFYCLSEVYLIISLKTVFLFTKINVAILQMEKPHIAQIVLCCYPTHNSLQPGLKDNQQYLCSSLNAMMSQILLLAPSIFLWDIFLSNMKSWEEVLYY